MTDYSMGTAQDQYAQEEKALLADFLETVWSNGDIEASDRFIAPSYTIHNDPGDPWHGQTLTLEAFKDRVRQSRAPFPDQRFDVQETIAEPGKVAVSWHWSGTFTEDMAGFKADGRKISMTGLTIYSFTDGKLSGHWQLCDRLGVFQQLSAGG